jgi:hypothetical protein
MSPDSEPLHGAKPPKPSPFPIFALVVLAGGAFAANAPGSDWAHKLLAGVGGIALCLMVFLIGERLLRSRRAAFLAGALTAAAALIWSFFPSGAGLLLLSVAAVAALAIGWVLARFSEGRLGYAAALTVRVILLVYGLALAADTIWYASALGVVPVACFTLAGLLVAVMSLAGKDRPWPAAEAAVLLAVAVVILSGLSGREG